ncbi:PD-(D/E)XK nuclease family protein [Thalassorhabdus alkalitolerans]|uniref:PD-(D/E)XK nuclease family protein n=1 Tax=Thalassorhabdus alkalitolerans TaxID=2282697 RepID=A0ABW0YSY8_9BACI
MFEIKDYPEFSWSLSRHKTLMECPRQYAYQYYTSHNGWLKNAEPVSRHAYRLKKLTSLEMLFGSEVHDIIEEVITYYLKTERVPSEEQLTERVKDRMNRAFIHSTRHLDDWLNKPKHWDMLHEIYYGESRLPSDKVSKMKSRLEVVIAHFLSSRTFQDILNKEKMQFIEAENFRHLMVGQLKVFVVLDLVYKDKEQNKWIIVDWKTGKKSEEDPYQLALYALYLQEAFSIKDLDDIVIRNEYLLEGTYEEHQLSPVTLEKVQELMGMSVDRMFDYLEEPGINRPLSIESFEQTTDTRKCSRCNFLEFCFPSKEPRS